MTRMKRRRSNQGESLIETMLSMFVVALGLAMLAGAIAKTSKINSQSASENVMLFMSTDSGDAFDGYAVEFSAETPFTSDPDNPSKASVTCYLMESENGETPLAYYK